ncbi:MAG: copper resistance system multicopper oxidase [Proteobacteria bacterium]|nr:copper resistance system multicopper oxidase [Pseudomonadota bacterium]
MRYFVFVLFLSISTLLAVVARAAEYSLDIARKTINVTGHPVQKVTVNGAIPAPTLRFREGEEAVIHVTNHMDVPTSIHWHGIIIPNEMDGVPGFNKFQGIMPGETFTYSFPIRQTGTYWYHAHSMGQEQDGLYGSLIFAPAGKDPIQTDRDYVMVLSDFTDEESDQVMGNLKMSSDYYSTARRTVGDFFADVKAQGFGKAWKNAKDWGQMRMAQTDLADVTGYTFLINGKNPAQNWTGLFTPGQRVRLRFINASSMSFFDVRIPGLKMNVVQSDGQNIEPVKVDEFRFAPAETYDVVVTPQEDKAYTIAAEPIDRTGFAIGTLATKEGMHGPAPAQRPRALLKMYIWTINGKKFSEADPIRLKYGERVRLNFTNDTMMAHPMHLHGMFVQLENGQPAEKMPNKHTVIVEPGKSYSVLLTADAPGEWAFHCHLLYHMMSGMMRKVIVAKLDSADMPMTGGSHVH